MDISVLGAWGEFLGGIAVIMSLIFVGVQVRYSAQASRAATRQAIADSMTTAGSALIDPVSFHDAMGKLESGMTTEELTPAQRYQVQMYATLYLRTLDNAFYQYKSGLLESAQWQSLRNGLVFNLRAAAGISGCAPI